MSLCINPDVVREAHERIERILSDCHIEALKHPDDCPLEVRYERCIRLRLGPDEAEMYFRSRMPPSDRWDAALIRIRDKAAGLKTLDQCDPC